MSTRALIRIEGNDVALYKHQDGYPDATLEWLETFHKDFLAKRGVDPIYEFAQLVRSTTRLGSNEDNYLGWGVVPFSKDNPDSMGAVYLYTLKDSGEVALGVRRTKQDDVTITVEVEVKELEGGN